MTSPGPDVTIVVVTYDSARDLPSLLASIDAAADGLDVAVVITDNASSDDSLGVARDLRPDAVLVSVGRNAGYSAGINAAIAAAPAAPATLVVNPDLVLHPGAIAPLLTALDEPGIGIAAPRILDPDGTVAPSLHRDPSVGRAFGEAVLGGRRAGRYPALGETIVDPDAYHRPATVAWASGAALCISRACTDAVGPWDESFFLYSEEVDYQLRARAAGFGVRYVPEAVVTHVEGEAHVSPDLWTLLTLNRVRFFRRHHSRAATAAYRAGVALNEGLRAAGGRDVHRAAFRALLRGDDRADDPRGGPRP